MSNNKSKTKFEVNRVKNGTIVLKKSNEKTYKVIFKKYTEFIKCILSDEENCLLIGQRKNGLNIPNETSLSDFDSTSYVHYFRSTSHPERYDGLNYIYCGYHETGSEMEITIPGDEENISHYFCLAQEPFTDVRRGSILRQLNSSYGQCNRLQNIKLYENQEEWDQDACHMWNNYSIFTRKQIENDILNSLYKVEDGVNWVCLIDYYTHLFSDQIEYFDSYKNEFKKDYGLYNIYKKAIKEYEEYINSNDNQNDNLKRSDLKFIAESAINICNHAPSKIGTGDLFYPLMASSIVTMGLYCNSYIPVKYKHSDVEKINNVAIGENNNSVNIWLEAYNAYRQKLLPYSENGKKLKIEKLKQYESGGFRFDKTKNWKYAIYQYDYNSQEWIVKYSIPDECIENWTFAEHWLWNNLAIEERLTITMNDTAQNLIDWLSQKGCMAMFHDFEYLYKDNDSISEDLEMKRDKNCELFGNILKDLHRVKNGQSFIQNLVNICFEMLEKIKYKDDSFINIFNKELDEISVNDQVKLLEYIGDKTKEENVITTFVFVLRKISSGLNTLFEGLSPILGTGPVGIKDLYKFTAVEKILTILEIDASVDRICKGNLPKKYLTSVPIDNLEGGYWKGNSEKKILKPEDWDDFVKKIVKKNYGDKLNTVVKQKGKRFEFSVENAKDFNTGRIKRKIFLENPIDPASLKVDPSVSPNAQPFVKIVKGMHKEKCFVSSKGSLHSVITYAGIIFEAINVLIYIGEVASSKTNYDLCINGISLTGAMVDLIVAFIRKSSVQSHLIVISAVIDTGLNIMFLLDSLNQGNEESAIFYGVAASGSLCVAIGTLLLAGGSVSGPVGALIATIGVFLQIIGTVMALIYSENDYEKWVSHCYFGKEQDNDLSEIPSFVDIPYKDWINNLENQKRAYLYLLHDFDFEINCSYSTEPNNGQISLVILPKSLTKKSKFYVSMWMEDTHSQTPGWTDLLSQKTYAKKPWNYSFPGAEFKMSLLGKNSTVKNNIHPTRILKDKNNKIHLLEYTWKDDDYTLYDRSFIDQYKSSVESTFGEGEFYQIYTIKDLTKKMITKEPLNTVDLSQIINSSNSNPVPTVNPYLTQNHHYATLHIRIRLDIFGDGKLLFPHTDDNSIILNQYVYKEMKVPSIGNKRFSYDKYRTIKAAGEKKIWFFPFF